MTSLPRLIGFALVLLLIFLTAAVAAQAWLRGQSERLRAEAIAGKRLQFAAALPLVGADDGRALSEEDAARLGRVLNAQIQAGAAPAPAGPGTLRFTEPVGGGQMASVTFSSPASDQLFFLHQRVVMVLLIVALMLAAVFAIVVVARPRSTADAGSRPPWGFIKAEMGNLQHLARRSVNQGIELARERDVRQRAEEDAHLRQTLLNQALEEKIRLGQDLHDGLIQSLYASGLTLESTRELLARDPAEAGRRLQTSIDQINAAIREVRNYITGLSRGQLRREGLRTHVTRVTRELSAGRDVRFDLDIDEGAAAVLTDDQLIQCVQVMHEAISNALRHGQATQVTVRLHAGDRAVGVLVQDNGSGFQISRVQGTGHGLANMQARAESAGGTLQVDSSAGAGCRVVLTLPAETPA